MLLLKRYSREAIDTLRYDGLSILLWKILVKALFPVCRIGVEILFEKDLTQPLEPQRARAPITITEATEADIDRLVAAEHGSPPAANEGPLTDAEEYMAAVRARLQAWVADQYVEHMRRGERCFFASVGTDIVHINWIRFHRVEPIPHCVIVLQPGEAFTTDAYTPEEWRGRGIHGAVLSEMLLSAQRTGCRTAYTMTNLVKTASRRGIRRLGWRTCGTLLYLAPRGLGRAFLVCLSGSPGPFLRSLDPASSTDGGPGEAVASRSGGESPSSPSRSTPMGG